VRYFTSLARARRDVRKICAFTFSSAESWSKGIVSSVARVFVQYASRACCDAASTFGK
jgi:hypothetical protein